MAVQRKKVKKALVPTVKKPLYAVEYTEYERGWGSRCEGFSYFKTEKEAKVAIASFNAHNTSPTVPDWYMVAGYRGLTDKPLGKPY